MVIIVSFGLFSGEGGVAARSLEEGRILREAGEPVTLVTNKVPESRSAERRLLEQFRSDWGVAITEISDHYVRGPLYNVTKDAFFDLRLALVLGRIHRQTPIRLVIIHYSTACYPVVWFCRRHGIPSAFVIQGLIWDRVRSGHNPYGRVLTAAYRHANAYALRNIDWSLANSEYIRTLAIDHGAKPDRTHVIYNSINEQRFRPEPHTPKTIDVLYVGRFSVEKGIDTLADAIDRLPSHFRIHAVGDGALRPDFEKRMRVKNRNVTCPGWVKNEALPAILQSTKVQIVPSHSEPQPFVIAEAMACGVPVIASDVGGIPEMIQPGRTGWLVPPGDHDALAKAISSALGDPVRLQVVSENAQGASARFSLTRFTRDISRVYLSIISGHPIAALRA